MKKMKKMKKIETWWGWFVSSVEKKTPLIAPRGGGHRRIQAQHGDWIGLAPRRLSPPRGGCWRARRGDAPP
jgi:hypothetical protein